MIHLKTLQKYTHFKRRQFTWNISAAAIAIRQQANVFATFGCCFIWNWLWIEWFGASWWMTIDVYKFGCLRNDRTRRFQCWPLTSAQQNNWCRFEIENVIISLLLINVHKTYGGCVPRLAVGPDEGRSSYPPCA